MTDVDELVTPQHEAWARELRARARTGWFEGTEATALLFVARIIAPGVTEPELTMSLALSRDRGAHSCGWWRNAEYEVCWHLSMAAKVVQDASQDAWDAASWESIPRDESRFWTRLIFRGVDNLLWFEPGGGDPHLTDEQRREHATFWHMRLFLDPESLDDRLLPWTGRPFIPLGEVYDLTRWLPDLTPAKVDR